MFDRFCLKMIYTPFCYFSKNRIYSFIIIFITLLYLQKEPMKQTIIDELKQFFTC